jgi:tetratricopeptide (TPR) repeat protein
MDMNRELGTRYYRLALSAAAQRNLSSAQLYARYACLFDGDHEDAAKLLDLCLYELGESAGGEAEGLDDGLGSVRALAEKKQWRAAAKAAGAVPRQSVRVLNIQGCLWAAADCYAKAAGCFAKALAKDRDNQLAAAALADLAQRPQGFWKILRACRKGGIL